jgi:U4/U6.U5 tri-snRNP-associated protein 1
MDDENSLSVEETNKLRLKLGLKPLQITGDSSSNQGNASVHDQERVAVENFKSLQKSKKAAEDEIEKQAQFLRKRDRETHEKTLVGKSLASEEDKDLDDTEAWLRRSKRRQVEIQKGIQIKKKEEMKAQKAAATKSYNQQDLKGLRVGHRSEDFEANEEKILVLKDSRIGEEESEDELVNEQMLESDKKRRYEEQLRKKNANSYDDGLMTRSILSHYDDGDDYEDSGFVIGNKKSSLPKNVPKELEGREMISLNTTSMEVTGNVDYMTKDEISFKKLKKKKKRSAIVKKSVNNDLPDPELISSFKAAPDTFIDDQDLQSALALSRKQKIKVMSYEDIARDTVKDDTDITAAGKGLVISEASEFVGNLNSSSNVTQNSSIISTDFEAKMNVEDIQEQKVDQKSEPMTKIHQEPQHQLEPEEIISKNKNAGVRGIAATLQLLKRQNAIEKKSEQELELEKSRLETEKWATARRIEIEKRKQNDMNLDIQNDEVVGKPMKMSREEVKDIETRFKNYKPKLDLDHVDEFGRVLSWKDVRFVCFVI